MMLWYPLVTSFNTRDVLVVPPRDDQLHHVAVIPLSSLSETGLHFHHESKNSTE